MYNKEFYDKYLPRAELIEELTTWENKFDVRVEAEVEKCEKETRERYIEFQQGLEDRFSKVLLADLKEKLDFTRTHIDSHRSYKFLGFTWMKSCFHYGTDKKTEEIKALETLIKVLDKQEE